MTALKFYKCALLAVLGLTSQAMSTVGAQDRAGMTPFVGETAAEFEARKKGLPPPTPVIEPSTVTLDADARGHFARQLVESQVALDQRADELLAGRGGGDERLGGVGHFTALFGA